MYQNVFFDKKTGYIFIWDDASGMRSFPYPRYAYKRKIGGKYKSLYGDELEKVTAFNDNDQDLFESDVHPETRMLIDLYENSDEPSEGHRVVVIDIEVSIKGGFPDVDTADKPITAIALHDSTTDKYYSFILDPDKKIKNSQKGNEVIKSFQDEDNLLESFLNKWEEIAPTIVTGWNIDGFDMGYIHNRIVRRLGKKSVYRLSPIQIAYQNKFTKRMIIAGVSCLDYIKLYKKFIGVEKPSYTLGAIGKEEVGIDKVTYRGSLEDLYKEDIHKYVEYNLTDVKIVVALDKKLDFLYLARSTCHKGHVPYEWFEMSSRWIDGAILTYLRRNNLIAPNKPIGGREEYERRQLESDDDESKVAFIGAFVKEPHLGLHDWIYSADITSLYPSTIMTLNISPETKVGVIDGWDYEQYSKGHLDPIKLGGASYSLQEFMEMKKDGKMSVSTNGVVYRMDKVGLVPFILDQWFSERKEYRKLAKKYADEGDKEKEQFYDRRQLRQKIFLNSVYGTLGLPIFRFYDRDNAEAVTLCGQTIIKMTENFVNHYYWKKFEQKGKSEMVGKDFVKYIDTDSVYLSSSPLAELEEVPPADMKEFTIKTVEEVASKINEYYDFCVPRVFNVNKHRIKITEDVIASTGFWVAKKRYALLKVYDMEKRKDVISKDGKPGKLHIKGIDVVRTGYPKKFRTFTENILEMILRKERKKVIDDRILEFKASMKDLNIEDIAKNTSVKFISQDGKKDYNPSDRRLFRYTSGSPAQVKAALFYSDLLKHWKLNKKVEPIHHGQKIKWVYLKNNEFGLDCLALKADGTDPDEILEFINKYIDRNALYEHELKSKLGEFYDVLQWKYPSEILGSARDLLDFGDE